MAKHLPDGPHGDTDQTMTKAKTTALWRLFHPSRAALGVMVAALVAAVILAVTRQPPPPRRHWKRLVAVAFGVVLGFPLFMTIAMQTVPAAHGGIVLGVLPLATTAAPWSSATP